MNARATLVVMVCMMVGGCAARQQAALARFEFNQPHMGVQARIVLFAEDSARAQAAAHAAYGEIARLEAVMSDFRPDSELMQLCARSGRGPVALSKELYGVLERAIEISAVTGGAFDVTIGPVSQLWRQARQTGAAPTSDELAAAHRSVNWRNVILDPRQGTATLLHQGMRIDLGGIGQGYAADRALAVLRARGVTRCLVDLSGDIALGDPPPGQPGWAIALPAGERELPTLLHLHTTAISTSGDAEQRFELDGECLSHIIDPRDAHDFGTMHHRTVTVIAPDCTTADALATALSVLDPQRGIELVDSLTGVSALIVEEASPTARGPRVIKSANFPSGHEMRRPHSPASNR